MESWLIQFLCKFFQVDFCASWIGFVSSFLAHLVRFSLSFQVSSSFIPVRCDGDGDGTSGDGDRDGDGMSGDGDRDGDGASVDLTR